MFDNLFDKAYETQGTSSLSVSPEFLMAVLAIVSLVYIFYCIGSMAVEKGARFYFEKYIFPFINFYLLGCCIGQSGYGCIFGVVDGTNDGSDKIKYTISNIKDWHFAKYALIAGIVCIIFVFIVQVLLAKNPGLFVRDVLFFVSLSVFGFCVARFAMTVQGFLLKLLFLPTSALAFICQFTWVIALFLWILPTSAIAAMNKASEEKEKKAIFASASSAEEETQEASGVSAATRFPATLTDDNGESWRLLSESGDHAEYECRKTGKRKTVWYTGGYVNLPSGWR